MNADIATIEQTERSKSVRHFVVKSVLYSYYTQSI